MDEDTNLGEVIREGAGPALVLLHSGLSTWREWRCVLPMLGRTRNVLVPTLPGSYGGPKPQLVGRSFLQVMADYVEHVLDDAGWTAPVPMVGSSHGGVVALELAARGRASTVMALAPPWMSTRTVTAYGGMFGATAMLLRVVRPLDDLGAWGWTPEPLRATIGALTFHGSRRRMALADQDLLITARSVRDFPLLTLGRTAATAPFLPDFAQIASPVTLVWGTKDRLAPLSMAQRWKHAIPHAELVRLPDLPHFPHLRDPERISALIIEQTANSRAQT